MLRVAHANRVKLQTLTGVTFDRSASPWARDIDRSANDGFLKTLSERTGSTVQELKAGMISAYEGVLFERHNAQGNTPWVLPLGIYHRMRRSYGMQFCPECLFFDSDPYFRRKWRLSLATICDMHNCLLHDRCPNCEAPVIYYRNDLGHRRGWSLTDHTLCWRCGFDLRRAPVLAADWLDARTHVALWSLLTFVDCGLGIAGSHNMGYSHLLLSVLHRMCEMLVSSSMQHGFDRLQRLVSGETGVALPAHVVRKSFEQLAINDRHRVLISALWLLMDWPDRFVRICRSARITRSHIVAELESIPYWFDTEVRRHLDRSFYVPNDLEVDSISAYLVKNGVPVTNKNVSRLLGGKSYKASRYL